MCRAYIRNQKDKKEYVAHIWATKKIKRSVWRISQHLHLPRIRWINNHAISLWKLMLLELLEWELQSYPEDVNELRNVLYSSQVWCLCQNGMIIQQMLYSVRIVIIGSLKVFLFSFFQLPPVESEIGPFHENIGDKFAQWLIQHLWIAIWCCGFVWW